MFVIFPADELILMTYGAAIPRISPRPTLDCLREPQVPLEFRSTHIHTANAITPTPTPTTATTITSANIAKVNATATAIAPNVTSFFASTAETAAPPSSFASYNSQVAQPNNSGFLASPVHTTAFTYDTFAPVAIPEAPTSSQSLPPTPTRRTSRSSQRGSKPPSLSPSNRSSVRSTRSQPTPPPSLAAPPALTFTPSAPSMSKQQPSPQPSPQQRQGAGATSRPSLERGRAVRGGTPQPSSSPYNSSYYDDSGGAAGGYAYGGEGTSASSLEPLGYARDRSPSIFLEPPSPDPTQPVLGPGWGRPMSPMDLPPPPPTTNKSPTLSKSRLRPKLHIPLGRLGRSSSSDQRESNRLREDLQLHVENPIFNSENLRQRNFDAFFESGESKYKLQPKTPGSGPADSMSSGSGYSPPLDRYEGVYTAPRSATAGNSLFAPSPRTDGKGGLNERSKSTEQYEPRREQRAASVSGGVPQKDFLGRFSSGQKNRSFFGWRGPRGGSLSPQASMASYTGVLKDYGHSSLSEAFKSQNNVNFKLIKTVSDFTETLAHLYEEHATALQTLVSNYRKKNGELRKERPACHMSIFQAWETFLQEVETDSQSSNDVASVLSRQVSRPMLDKSFHRKVQSRKIFTHRESFETIIAKTEEKLSKCRLDYKQCYMSHRQNPTQLSLTEYIDAHNAYVQQLHATNAMLEVYHCETVPQLMQELEEIHNELCSIIADSILQGADVIANKATDQAKRYNSLTTQCSSVSPSQDLQNFVRILPLPSQAQKLPRRVFAPPAGEADDGTDYNEMAPILRNELVFDRHSTLSLRAALDSLKRESLDLEMQIRQLQDAIDTLNRTQSRGIEGQLFNKVNELQEDLSMKKFDLRAKQLHLAAIRAQALSKKFE